MHMQSSTSYRHATRGKAGIAARIAQMRRSVVSDRARFFAFVGFALLVAFTGGGSRADIASLLILRPLSILFAAYAFLTVSRADLARVRVPLAIVAGLMILCALQLVPLPPAWWSALPGRGVAVDAAAALGLDPVWRPLSLAPSRTWNTLFSLFVPLAAILFISGFGSDTRRMVMPVLLGIALLSSLVAILQIAGMTPLYLYEITNRGYPVGLFSNRNHQAVLLAWSLPAIAFFVAGYTGDRNPRFVLATAVILMLLVMVMVVLTGSRAGLAITVAAGLAACFILYRSKPGREIVQGLGKGAKWLPVAAAGLLALPIAGLLFALFGSARETAFSRLFELQDVEEARWQYLPLL